MLIKYKIKHKIARLKKIIIQFRKNINIYNFFRNPIILILSFLFLFWVFEGFYKIKISECGVITRLGKFNKIVKFGLHWKPIFIDDIKRISIKKMKEIITSGLIITADDNLIYIQTKIQYKIINPRNYFFTVKHPKFNLCDIIDNSLYNFMINVNLHRVTLSNNVILLKKLKNSILASIRNYNIGIVILDIKIQKIWPPAGIVLNMFKKSLLIHKYRNKNIQEIEIYTNEVFLQVIKKSKYISSRNILYNGMLEESKK